MAPRSRASTAAGRRRASARSGERAAAHPRPRKPASKSPAGRSPKRSPKRSASSRRAAAPPKRRAPKRATTTRPRRAPRRTRESSGFSWPQRLVLVLCALAVLAGAYLLWFRDSSLVAVNDVEVVGVSTDREAIVAELTRVGEGMSTLNFDAEEIERAARAFPTVESVSADPNFPHGLRIEVAERPPAVVVRGGGEEVAAAADGTLLEGLPVPEEGLPTIELSKPPVGKVLGGEPLDEAVVAGAAPEPLRALIEEVSTSEERGVEVTLRGGIPVVFGDSGDASAKWAAAATVLADPELDYVRELDVRTPSRPSVDQDGPVTMPATVDPPA